MKVDPVKNDEYLKLEHDIWKPMHQERIRQGHMRSWTLYEVHFPVGSHRECDYRTLNTYNSLADMDRSILDVAAKAHPSIPIAELNRRTGSGRNFVEGELWYQVDQAQ
jgi:hypothetical protein